jgi:TadE-like protein
MDRTLATHGQAMVEFAMIIGIFLTALLGAVSAGLYTVQRSAAVTAVAAGARAAATASPGNPNAPNVNGGLTAAERIASNSMIGTTVVPASACPQGPAGVAASHVVLCAYQSGPGMVTVRMVGKPRNPVPVSFGFDWMLDVQASVHQVTFEA